jgi:KUP system potassium uptake protein
MLVLAFGSSERLASVYGVAISFTMLCTTLTYYVVVTRVLHWNRAASLALVAIFVLVDGSLAISSLPKILHGGWIPLGISATLVLMSTTWLEGRRGLSKALAEQQIPIETVLEKLPAGVGLQGTMVFLTPDPRGVPFLARHRWIRERAQEERIVVLNIARAATPYLTHEERVTVERLSLRLVRVIARFGYMEAPRIDPIFRAADAFGLQLDRDDTSFFYADPKIVARPDHGMAGWRRELFATLQRNARPLPDDLRITAERRVELGVTVEI